MRVLDFDYWNIGAYFGFSDWNLKVYIRQAGRFLEKFL
jgi:hypothetical protein